MTSSFIPPEPLQTAVLFLVFNRPDTTAQVFEAIRQAKPPRLYIAADGPRANREGEAERVARVREIATAVDWPCEVKTLFREKNLGCKYAVSVAITWFFEQEEQGIILEDDCLPHPDFFTFCENLLYRHAEDERVNQDLRELLRSPLLAVDGDFYMIEVPQPLTMDRLRQRVRKLRFLSDGTFSGSVARIKRPALAALIEDLIDRNDQAKVFKELKKAGYEGTDPRSVIYALLKKTGSRLAGQVGEELLGKGGEAIGWVFDKAWARLKG